MTVNCNFARLNYNGYSRCNFSILHIPVAGVDNYPGVSAHKSADAGAYAQDNGIRTQMGVALSILAQFCGGEDEDRKQDIAAKSLNDSNYHPDEEQALFVESGGGKLQP